VAGEQQPHQQHGQGKEHQQLGPALAGEVEEAGVGETAGHEKQQGDQVESQPVVCCGGGHGGQTDGQQADQIPKTLSICGELKAAAVGEEQQSREQTEHHADQGTLGEVGAFIGQSRPLTSLTPDGRNRVLPNVDLVGSSSSQGIMRPYMAVPPEEPG